jgi:hypothetical protein
MRPKNITASVLCLFCLLFVSCKKKADAVILVKQDGVTAKGQAEIVFDPNGGYHVNAWLPGNIVIFRVDKTVEVGSGKAGTVYLINQDKQLESIDQVDLKKSDDELTAMYLKSAK